MQEALTIYKAVVRLDSTPASKEAATAQLRAALVRLEGEPLPEADCAAHRSLEALRLEDPAAICGCWNPGYAACLAMAGCSRSFLKGCTPACTHEQACSSLMFAQHADILSRS